MYVFMAVALIYKGSPPRPASASVFWNRLILPVWSTFVLFGSVNANIAVFRSFYCAFAVGLDRRVSPY